MKGLKYILLFVLAMGMLTILVSSDTQDFEVTANSNSYPHSYNYNGQDYLFSSELNYYVLPTRGSYNGSGCIEMPAQLESISAEKKVITSGQRVYNYKMYCNSTYSVRTGVSRCEIDDYVTGGLKNITITGSEMLVNPTNITWIEFRNYSDISWSDITNDFSEVSRGRSYYYCFEDSGWVSGENKTIRAYYNLKDKRFSGVKKYNASFLNSISPSSRQEDFNLDPFITLTQYVAGEASPNGFDIDDSGTGTGHQNASHLYGRPKYDITNKSHFAGFATRFDNSEGWAGSSDEYDYGHLILNDDSAATAYSSGHKSPTDIYPNWVTAWEFEINNSNNPLAWTNKPITFSIRDNAAESVQFKIVSGFFNYHDGSMWNLVAMPAINASERYRVKLVTYWDTSGASKPTTDLFVNDQLWATNTTGKVFTNKFDQVFFTTGSLDTVWYNINNSIMWNASMYGFSGNFDNTNYTYISDPVSINQTATGYKCAFTSESVGTADNILLNISLNNGSTYETKTLAQCDNSTEYAWTGGTGGQVLRYNIEGESNEDNTTLIDTIHITVVENSAPTINSFELFNISTEIDPYNVNNSLYNDNLHLRFNMSDSNGDIITTINALVYEQSNTSNIKLNQTWTNQSTPFYMNSSNFTLNKYGIWIVNLTGTDNNSKTASNLTYIYLNNTNPYTKNFSTNPASPDSDDSVTITVKFFDDIINTTTANATLQRPLLPDLTFSVSQMTFNSPNTFVSDAFSPNEAGNFTFIVTLKDEQNLTQVSYYNFTVSTAVAGNGSGGGGSSGGGGGSTTIILGDTNVSLKFNPEVQTIIVANTPKQSFKFVKVTNIGGRNLEDGRIEISQNLSSILSAQVCDIDGLNCDSNVNIRSGETQLVKLNYNIQSDFDKSIQGFVRIVESTGQTHEFGVVFTGSIFDGIIKFLSKNLNISNDLAKIILWVFLILFIVLVVRGFGSSTINSLAIWAILLLIFGIFILWLLKIVF